MSTITVGTNSWASVSYADTYFADKWGASFWASLSDAQKTQLLISSYKWINQQSTLNIAATSTADIVKQAQCELSQYMYDYYDDHRKREALYNQGVTDFRISQFSESLKGASFPVFISAMLSDYAADVGGSFPNVTRSFDAN